MVLKSLYRLLILILIFNIIEIKKNDYKEYKDNIDNVLSSKLELKKYNGYLHIPKYNYFGLIKSGESKQVLDSNNILLLNNGSSISDKVGNIVLAGHNNKYVFSILYKLELSDELIIYDSNKEYKFVIYDIKIVDITDTYILDNIYDNKIVTLITCTKDNQRRLVVRGKIT